MHPCSCTWTQRKFVFWKRVSPVVSSTHRSGFRLRKSLLFIQNLNFLFSFLLFYFSLRRRRLLLLPLPLLCLELCAIALWYTASSMVSITFWAPELNRVPSRTTKSIAVRDPTCWTDYLAEASPLNGWTSLCLFACYASYPIRFLSDEVVVNECENLVVNVCVLIFILAANRWSNWPRVGSIWSGGRGRRQKSFWRKILLICLWMV